MIKSYKKGTCTYKQYSTIISTECAVFFALWARVRSRGPAPPVSHMGIKTCRKPTSHPRKTWRALPKPQHSRAQDRREEPFFLEKDLNKHKHQEALSQTWEKEECEKETKSSGGGKAIHWWSVMSQHGGIEWRDTGRLVLWRRNR